MDCEKTAMGSRMIKKWIQRPLVKKEAIVQRQDVIALLCDDIALAHALEQLLMRIGDIERIIGRIALDRAPVADYCALSKALTFVPDFRGHLSGIKNSFLIN